MKSYFIRKGLISKREFDVYCRFTRYMCTSNTISQIPLDESFRGDNEPSENFRKTGRRMRSVSYVRSTSNEAAF